VSDPAPRPGAALGDRPERRDVRRGWLERTTHGLSGALARRRAVSPTRLDAFAASVTSLGRELADRGDDALGDEVTRLRSRLTYDGLREESLARSFAIVREVARRTLGTPHYDVQIIGGRVMARGMLAEMETGEGKTLTATLPACSAALAGVPVHVISANDYLALRDAEAMRPLYEALGLSVGAVSEAKRDPAERRDAYACDVTYGTSKVIAFDYLRDRLSHPTGSGGAPHPRTGSGGAREAPLLRGLCFAVVDEADSVLIDDARTPLVLAAPGDCADQQRTYRSALRLASQLVPARDFHLDRREGTIVLSEAGSKRLERMSRSMGGLWSGPLRREGWVREALRALHLFLRDRDYLVREERVQIIDQSTGRVAPDRSWDHGLQQLIELKERCPMSAERETLARITVQGFFRRYLRLAGTTGTAREVARELWSVYDLNTVRIPTRRPVRRTHLGCRVYAREEEKWEAVAQSVGAAHRSGRPVLVGTGSVEASERLARVLALAGFDHEVLNARHEAREAAIVSRAGRAGRVTVATPMAGRGTDIRLEAGVAERGGLHVIATQRCDARRLDRQLVGRCGRQGDPGSVEAILSLEDEPVVRHVPERIRHLAARIAGRGAPLWGWLGELLTSLPQRADERRHARMRRDLMELEAQLGDLLAFSGPGE
jgi:preprotein translocase subunit SecA